MSVKLGGIDLNSVVDSIEENNEGGLDNSSADESLIKYPGDPDDVRGVSIDVDRVLGEGSEPLNTSGLVNEGLTGEMGAVDRDGSLKAEIVSANIESEVKEKISENNKGFVGGKTGNLGLELERVGTVEVEAMIERDQNQGAGVNVLPQYAHAREKVSLVVDLNASHQSPEDVVSENGRNGTGGNEGLIESNSPVSVGLAESIAPITEADQNGNPNMLIKDEIINGPSEDLDRQDVKSGALIPKVRGEESQTEKEGEFFVSDLVWGKVRSHPWWPGQIFEPSAASEKAMKYFKKDSYLIAYFGDQTFAWNEASKIKPFWMYFSQMEKQSNVENFSRAVDGALNEVSRRIESGLACQCLQEEVLANVKSQLVECAGIQEQSSRICGGDGFSTAGSFLPANLVNYLKSLAEAPNAAIDRLEFVRVRAQFLAFNRWKGYHQLPVFEEFDGILENDADPSGLQANGVMEGVSRCNEDGPLPSGKAKSPRQDSSQKRKHVTTGDQCNKQKKHIMELVRGSSLSLPNVEKKSEWKSSRKLPSGSSGQKRMVDDVILNDSGVKRRKGLSLQRARNKTSSLPRKLIKVGEHICIVTGKLGGSTPSPESGSRSLVGAAVEHGGKSVYASGSGVSTMSKGESLKARWALREYPPTDEMLSKLVGAAKNPLEGYSSLISVAGFFTDFRNLISWEYNNLQKEKRSSGKQKAENSCELESTGELKFEGMEDSYWTDRIIESRLDEQVLFEPDPQAEKDILVAEPESVNGMNLNTLNDHETNAMVAELDAENPSHITDENFNERSPTALILNFTSLESVPSITTLNKIFNRYGTLNESETEVLSKSKHAKVVFKRRSDAETAFSSTGKFSIFGPSLVSYRLKYLPAPRKASTASKTKGRRKKSTSAEAGAM